MGRKDNIDDEWRRFNESLPSAENEGHWPIGVERTSFTGGGPRDWTPAPPDDDDVNDVLDTLDETYHVQDSTHLTARDWLLIAILIAGIAITLASIFSLINVSATVTIISLIAVFCSLGGLFALHARGDDDFDDGIRL